MSTPSEQSNIAAVLPASASQPNPSSQPPRSEEPPETFEPPGIPDLASLTDGRRPGEFETVYSKGAWIQITIELVYLLGVLLFSLVGLVLLAHYMVMRPTTGFVFRVMGGQTQSLPLVTWVTVGLAGACGGCASSLKWLYHGVAKKCWHRDRIIWRLTVPVLSAVLAVFSGLMIISGIVPFLSKTPLTTPATGAAFGFFVGFFSDNVLAALQKLAFRIFGTVNKDGSSAQNE